MPIVKYRTKQDIINTLWQLSDGQHFPRYDEIGGLQYAARKYGGMKKLREETGLMPQKERSPSGKITSTCRKPNKKTLQFMAALHFTQKHGEVDVNACMKAVRNGEFEVRIV